MRPFNTYPPPLSSAEGLGEGVFWFWDTYSVRFYSTATMTELADFWRRPNVIWTHYSSGSYLLAQRVSTLSPSSTAASPNVPSTTTSNPSARLSGSSPVHVTAICS
jgi:hypothetical protein